MNLEALSTATLESMVGRGPEDSYMERAIKDELKKRKGALSEDTETPPLFKEEDISKESKNA